MKVIKIFVILTAVLLLSCGERKPNVKRVYKYKVGDVVSLKPDGQRATIMNHWDLKGADYIVKCYSVDDERYSEVFVNEFEIFNKVQ